MAANKFSHLPKFREVFMKNKDIKMTSWYPGHMFKGMLQMQAKLATVDCVIEVHDARIPFSGRNPKFYTSLTAIRPHILVLNKMDLADLSQKENIVNKLKEERFHNVFFTDCSREARGDIAKIVPLAVELIRGAEHFDNAFKTEYRMMVIGIPNVGKSSLINKIRNKHLGKKKATHVGAKPGITKSVLERIKVCDDPHMYLLDTPGILQPRINNLETGMRLAACSTVNDSVVGEQLIADYMLYWLNKNQNFRYVDHLNLSEPVDDIRLLLLQICKNLDRTLKVRQSSGQLITVPDYNFAANIFIREFRSGAFGKMQFDHDIVNKSVE